MQIHSIQLKNIKSHRDLELNFVPGINVLLGANGVGKSTIFEAVGYALFGVDAQSFVGKVERFISIGAKKGEIAIVFQPTGAERFRVSRTVGTPSKWLLAKQQGDGFEVEEHKDNKETEVRLKELLGLANGRSLAEQFELVIGPFQNDFLGPFVIKQPAKRRDKFDEILGIDSWRKTFTETNPLLKAIQNRIEVLQSAIGPLQDQVAHLPGKRAAHTAAKEQLVQIEAEWQKQQQVLQGMLAQLLQIDQRAELIKALQVEIDKLQERIANGMEKIGSQKSLIAEAEKAQQIVVENSAGKAAYEQAEKRLLTLREKQKQQRALEQQVAALDKQLGSLRAQYDAQRQAITQAAQELDNEAQALEEKRRTLVVDESMQALAARLPEIREAIQQLRSQLGQLEGRRVGLEEGNEKLAEGICPFFQEPCLNIAETPPGDLFSAKFAELAAQRKRMEDELNRMVEEEGKALAASDQLKAYQVQANGLNDQLVRLAAKRQDNQQRTAGLGQLQQDLAALERRLTEQQKALQGYGQLAQEIEASEAQQKKYQPARDLFVANQEQAGRLQERQAELQRYLQLLDQLQKELVDKQAQFASTSKDYDAAQHQQLWEQKDALAHEVGALGQKVENGKAELARLAAEIESLQELARQITAKQAQVKAFGAKEQLVKYLRNRVFRNVSGYLSERFREEISQRANRIYRIIAENDEELDWGEDYRIVLRDMVAGELRERSDDQLSGGQTMSAVVALRLAMLQTIGARLAFFDEPTSNLDASRRENLAHAFRAIDVGKEEVTEHWYDQLFLISHDVAFSEVTDQIIPLD